MSKEKNKIHVARHIDLLQESANIVPNRRGRLDNKCPVSWKRGSVVLVLLSSSFFLLVLLLPPPLLLLLLLPGVSCRHSSRAERTEVGAQQKKKKPRVRSLFGPTVLYLFSHGPPQDTLTILQRVPVSWFL